MSLVVGQSIGSEGQGRCWHAVCIIRAVEFETVHVQRHVHGIAFT